MSWWYVIVIVFVSIDIINIDNNYELMISL